MLSRILQVDMSLASSMPKGPTLTYVLLASMPAVVKCWLMVNVRALFTERFYSFIRFPITTNAPELDSMLVVGLNIPIRPQIWRADMLPALLFNKIVR